MRARVFALLTAVLITLPYATGAQVRSTATRKSSFYTSHKKMTAAGPNRTSAAGRKWPPRSARTSPTSKTSRKPTKPSARWSIYYLDRG